MPLLLFDELFPLLVPQDVEAMTAREINTNTTEPDVLRRPVDATATLIGLNLNNCLTRFDEPAALAE